MILEPLLWPDSATITAEGHLAMAGCDVVELVREYGSPLYLLDEATVCATAHAFTDALRRFYPGAASTHYAGKALLNTAVAQLVTGYGLGLDCVSLGELAVARHAGVDLKTVHLHGNAKPAAELAQALAWGTGRIVVDSLDELAVLGELARGLPRPQAILLRLNPGVDVHTHTHIQTGQLDSKFGLPIATGMAEDAVRMALALPDLRLAGLHMHLGSQLTALEPIGNAVASLFDFAASMQARYGWVMQEFSPGGGLATPYAPGDPAPAIPEYVQLIGSTTLEHARRIRVAPPRLVLEPGRSLIARAVVAVYSVTATKTVEGIRRFVAIDGGMGDNIRPALYGARYSALRADQPHAPPSGIVTIVGRFCESGDVLLRDIHLPALEAGALVALPMAGAYTLSMASNYNLVPRPALVLLRDRQSYLIQRRETPDDLFRRDLPLASTAG